jgi:hypothetical protein
MVVIVSRQSMPHNVLVLGESVDFLAQMFIRRYKLSVTTNVSAENETLPFW